jgi:hypothetical protein
MKKINFSGGEPFLVQGGRFLGTYGYSLVSHTGVYVKRGYKLPRNLVSKFEYIVELSNEANYKYVFSFATMLKFRSRRIRIIMLKPYSRGLPDAIMQPVLFFQICSYTPLKKGTVSRYFLLQVFFMNHLPPSP